MDVEKLTALLTIPADEAVLAAKVAALTGATIHIGAGISDLTAFADIDSFVAKSGVTFNFASNTPESGDH